MGITGLPEYQIRRNVNEREANRKTGSGSSCGAMLAMGKAPIQCGELFILAAPDWSASMNSIRWSFTIQNWQEHIRPCYMQNSTPVNCPDKTIWIIWNSRACWPDVFDRQNRMVLQIQAQTRTTAVRFWVLAPEIPKCQYVSPKHTGRY